MSNINGPRPLPSALLLALLASGPAFADDFP